MRAILLLLLFSSVGAAAQNNVVVHVSNFENNKGVCLVCLFDNASAFTGKGQPVKKIIVAATTGTAVATFSNVPVGTYAVSVIHDANANNKFDTNFLGIPTEGYGASQNKLPFASAPKFDANKFSVAANATVTVPIKLRYIL